MTSLIFGVSDFPYPPSLSSSYPIASPPSPETRNHSNKTSSGLPLRYPSWDLPLRFLPLRFYFQVLPRRMLPYRILIRPSVPLVFPTTLRHLSKFGHHGNTTAATATETATQEDEGSGQTSPVNRLTVFHQRVVSSWVSIETRSPPPETLLFLPLLSAWFPW